MIILSCKDIPNSVSCCEECHEGKLIHTYAFDNLGMGIIKRIPDIITIRLDYCCSQVHVVKELPESFWVSFLTKNYVKETERKKQEDKPIDAIEDFLS